MRKDEERFYKEYRGPWRCASSPSMCSANAVAMRGAVAAVAMKRIDAGRGAPFRFHIPLRPATSNIAASLANSSVLSPALPFVWRNLPHAFV